MESYNKITPKIEAEKQENPVEQMSFSGQEKNISEVFKLCPELENIALEGVGIDESLANKTVRLYRIENRNKKVEKSKEGGNNDKYIGQWFTTDLSYAIDYIENTYNKNELGINYDDTVLHYAELPVKEASKYLVSKETIATEKLEAEPDNFHIEDRSNLQTLELADLLHTFKKGGIIRTKFGFDKKHIEPSILEKISDLAPTDGSFDDVMAFSEKRKEAVVKYEKYLETIFPESKLKEVVWHGTTSEEGFDNFDIDKESSFGFEKHGGIFFTSMIEDAKTRGSGSDAELAKKIIPVLLNVKNPLITGQKEFPATVENSLASGKEEIDTLLANEEVVKRWQEIGWTYRIENDELIVTKPIIKKQAGLMNSEGNLVVDLSQNAMFIGNISQWTTKPLANVGYDTIIDNNAASNGLSIEVGFNDQGRVLQQKSWFIALKADNIHILGSESDIEKFKEFVSKNEATKDKQSIEEFLKEQGLEHVPKIKTNFFFNQHATAEDGQMVADRLKDKDIFIQENAGWDDERLLTWQKVTSGEFTAEQAIEHEKARGKAFFWTDYYKAIFENIHGTNKEVLLVDIKDDSELYKEIYDLMKTDGVYWNILDRSKTYDEVIEHIGDASQLESLSQEERENEILKNTKQNLLELLKNKTELQNKEELNILFSMGSFHTRLYHEMKKDGNDVTREHQSMPYTFSPRMEVERLVHFKGREVAESSMPKVLLYLLLGKTGVFPLDQMKHEQQHMVMKKFNTDAQIRELYERYQKSESDEQFRKEINGWIAEQYKK